MSKEYDTFEANKLLSDSTKRELEKNPAKFRVLTGDRPTGKLHLGHYFGTLLERVRLQNMGVQTLVLIADYQVITDRDTTESIKENVYNLLADYIAAGIDPQKSIMFAHSKVPALNQLLLPFLSLVSDAELYRNPTVKAEHSASQKKNLSGLMLTYPVHQAADILFCKGNIVPVGKDQLPHIEMTRLIARRFNERFAHVFDEPVGVLTETPEILGLDGRKMSKSYNNAIELGFSADTTLSRIKKALTDSDRNITFDPVNRVGVSTLLTLASLTSGRTPHSIAEEIGDKGAGTLKMLTAEYVNSYFEKHRKIRTELLDNLDYLREVLQNGNERANQIADRTLAEVSEAMGMVY
jgi:tryptophanyl-tRNA synthetase